MPDSTSYVQSKYLQFKCELGHTILPNKSLFDMRDGLFLLKKKSNQYIYISRFRFIDVSQDVTHIGFMHTTG